MSAALSPEELAGVRRPLEAASWLPPRAYTDPAVWAVELERVLRPSWLVIARADRLSAAGDFLTAEIAGARVLLARGQDGVIRAFHNVCRHRGMWVAEGNGRTRAFTCPYHLWTYDLDGALRTRPASHGAFDDVTINCDLHQLQVLLYSFLPLLLHQH